jgi:hypothetical protein
MRSASDPQVHSETPCGTIVPTIAVLETWANFDWSDGCQIDEQQAFQPLTVVTRNHVYELIVIDGTSGLVRIRGGQFFPDWREVHLAGCSLGGSFLKLRGVYAGFGMELHVDGDVIVTSAVQRLTLQHYEFKNTH